jgi:hypothetical protein
MLTDYPEVSGSHKHKLLTKVTTNGDPEAERKKRKLEAKKQSMNSIEIEEIDDEADRHTSVPLRNPRHILEATDGSDDDNREDPAPGGSEKGEAPEESDEAELGMYLDYCFRH